MANKPIKRYKAPVTKDQAAYDSFQNFAARMGFGANRMVDSSTYGFNPITRNRVLLEWMYRGSWLCGVVVDAPADDMTRAGIDLQSTMDPDDIEKLQEAIQRFCIWPKLNETIKWSRLYGGAIAVMLIDGQDPETPLRIESIGADQFKGLLVMDRWMVEPSMGDLVKEFNLDLGLPRFYRVTAEAPALPRMKVHYSRVIRLEGVMLPYWQKQMENLWGLSVIERLFDRLVAFDSVTTGVAQLVYKAYLRTLKIPGLRQIIAAGGPMYEAMLQQVSLIRDFQSNEGLTLVDGQDEFDTHTFTFSGLDLVMDKFGEQISGAVQIPLTRLFGQAPAGLNATGESDMRNYYDGINQKQELTLRRALDTLLRVIAKSERVKIPEGFAFTFSSLWQLDDVQKAEIAGKIETAVSGAVSDNLITKATGLKELRQSSTVTGVFSNISDEDIEAAENEPPPGTLIDPVTGQPIPAPPLAAGAITETAAPPQMEGKEL